MKKGILVLVMSLGTFSICVGNSWDQNFSLTKHGNLNVLILEGTPFERGQQHGKALKQDIHELVKLWKQDIQKTYNMDADVFIEKFLAGTDYQKSIIKWTPDLWQEIEGISKGSDIDFDTLFAFQLVDEIWVTGRDLVADKCTTIGAMRTEKHPAVVAQNLDIPTFYHGFQTLLHMKDPGLEMETFLFTFPGFIATNGLNDHSVAVVVNAVQQLESSKDGLPVAFVIRGILQRKSYEEAVEFIKSIKHGAPQNYLIGGAVVVGSFECAATHVNQFIPFENALFTYHTNHPLKNQNYTPRFAEYLKSRKVSPENYQHPCPRFAALQNILKDNSTALDVKKLKDIFSNRETIINNPGTFGNTIMVMGNDPQLHISPGRPDEEPYQIFRFKK